MLVWIFVARKTTMEAPEMMMMIEMPFTLSITTRAHKQNAKAEVDERSQRQGEGHAQASQSATHRLKDE